MVLPPIEALLPLYDADWSCANLLLDLIYWLLEDPTADLLIPLGISVVLRLYGIGMWLMLGLDWGELSSNSHSATKLTEAWISQCFSRWPASQNREDNMG